MGTTAPLPLERTLLKCPFCGTPETDRFDLEGRRFLVFGCMFTPQVDPHCTDAELAERLARDFRRDQANGYFRGMCDRLHYFVTKGPGAEILIGGGATVPERSSEA